MQFITVPSRHLKFSESEQVSEKNKIDLLLKYYYNIPLSYIGQFNTQAV